MSNELLLTSIYRRAAISFVVLTALLLLLVAYVVLPNALVVVTPSIEDFENNYFFTVSPEHAEAEDYIEGVRFTTENVLEQSYNAQGEREVFDSLTGTITIVNNYSRSQALIRTTRLLTQDGTLLRLDENVTVLAGGSVEATVYLDDTAVVQQAIEPGRLTIPGLWEGIQDRIYGEITTPLVGDTITHKYVTSDDITFAQQDLRSRAESEAEIGLLDALASSQEVLPEKADEWSLVILDSVSEVWDIDENLAGISAEQFTIAGTFTFEGVFYNTESVTKKVNQKLLQEKSGAQANVQNSKVQITETEVVDSNAEIMVSINGKRRNIEKEGFLERNSISGLTSVQATTLLENVDGVEEVTIELSPFWVKKIPKNKIDLVILNN